MKKSNSAIRKSDVFEIDNLVPNRAENGTRWMNVGTLRNGFLDVEALYWPGRGYRGVDSPTKTLRVALAIAPPFVMISEPINNTTCLIGELCVEIYSKEVGATFKDLEDSKHDPSRPYKLLCCNGLSIDIMMNVANDLQLKLQVYFVRDGSFGSPIAGGWTGIIGDIIDGSAHLSFAPISVTSQRVKVVDFSSHYYSSTMTFLSSTKKMDIPILAFLVPFSAELWVAIFISLNVTALSVAVYEWLSPFGLNPWGRQRSKNFSYGSALWVTWGLLFSHLVAFKAPKSWPNKVLINVWGAFSVIFVASYTANIAALFAGLFNRRSLHENNMYSLKVGMVKYSAAEFYAYNNHPSLYSHMQKTVVPNFTEALDRLNSGRLEVLFGDSAILDHMRANDAGCTLQVIGSSDDIISISYAVAMPKGFPLKMKINKAISQYLASGHIEYLQHKWYGSQPCFQTTADHYKPQPLAIETVGGVFLMLSLGMIIGILILLLEHIVYKYALPTLRTKPKESVWRNRNMMFFSQKLYKFINCVELVSPHHSAKEMVNSIKSGHIMGLFQKSVKRKENEQRRRRKSKAQFFEMIQEITRVQKAEKALEGSLEILEVIPECEVSQNISAITSTVTTKDSSVTSDNSKTANQSSLLQSLTTTVSNSLLSIHRIVSPKRPKNHHNKKNPPEITIDYIPGPNPHEDYEGMIIVNKTQSIEDHSAEMKSTASKNEIFRSLSLQETKTSLGSKPSASSMDCPKEPFVSSTEECYACKEIPTIMNPKKDGKRKGKLQREARIEQSPEGNYESDLNKSNYSDSAFLTATSTSKTGNSNISEADCNLSAMQPRPLAISAPPSIFGDNPCDCYCHSENPSMMTKSVKDDFLCLSCSPCPYDNGFKVKSKSLDGTRIDPPRDFMSSADSLSNDVTQQSLPCSPHLLPCPSSSPNIDVPPGNIDTLYQTRNASLSSAQADGIVCITANSSPDPLHLRNITKGELWKLWQDSECQLRKRLLKIERERDNLVDKLSTTMHSNVNRRSDNLHTQSIALEVPAQFRDSSSKTKRTIQSRSVEEYMTTNKLKENVSSRNFEPRINKPRNFSRSAKSLEDNVRREWSSQWNPSFTHSSPSASVKRKRLPRRKKIMSKQRRCKSSPDTTKDDIFSPGSYSDSLNSLTSEDATVSSDDNCSSRTKYVGTAYQYKNSSLRGCRKRSTVKPNRVRHKRMMHAYSQPFKLNTRREIPKHFSSSFGYYTRSSSAEEEYTDKSYHSEASPYPIFQILHNQPHTSHGTRSDHALKGYKHSISGSLPSRRAQSTSQDVRNYDYNTSYNRRGPYIEKLNRRDQEYSSFSSRSRDDVRKQHLDNFIYDCRRCDQPRINPDRWEPRENFYRSHSEYDDNYRTKRSHYRSQPSKGHYSEH